MSKIKISLAVLVSVFLFTSFSGSFAGEKKLGDANGQTMCPVMDGKIDKQYFADYKGKRIYFCCPGCKDPFLKDPEKYMKKLKGVKLEDAPASDGKAKDGGSTHKHNH